MSSQFYSEWRAKLPPFRIKQRTFGASEIGPVNVRREFPHDTRIDVSGTSIASDNRKLAAGFGGRIPLD